jgi:hypothetical protein
MVDVSKAYKRLYCDLGYINSMNMQFVYHKLSLERMNICCLMEYRQYINAMEPFITHD